MWTSEGTPVTHTQSERDITWNKIADFRFYECGGIINRFNLKQHIRDARINSTTWVYILVVNDNSSLFFRTFCFCMCFFFLSNKRRSKLRQMQ